MKKNCAIAVSACLLFSAIGFAQGQLSPIPSFALGQPSEYPASEVKSGFPNYIIGNELNRPQAVAVDPSSGALYVADTSNNRVLCWKNPASAAKGAPADLVVGQRDMFSTLRGGPKRQTGGLLESGLNQPTGVVVDAAGNLYVADAGNNRIVRFSRPIDQPQDPKLAEFVIGQPNLQTGGANTGGRSASSLDTTDNSGAPYRVGLAFDNSGNLWVSDSGNNRVLRYAAATLAPGESNGPNADLVLGQADFESNEQLSQRLENRNERRRFRFPSGLAFDQTGRLFVTDDMMRALVFEPGFHNEKPASRVMGLTAVLEGQPIPDPINERSLGVLQTINNRTVWVSPEGVFTIGDTPFVVDTGANRVLRYPPYDQWPAETELIRSPAAVAVIGQDSLTSTTTGVNRGRAEPAADTFWSPVYAAVGPGTKVYIADSENHRVLAFPDISTGPEFSNGPPYAADNVFGQIDFEYRTVNRLEGREFFFNSPFPAADVVIDWNADPPHLYVADPNNNRILGFRDARRVRNGTFADIVLGQPGMFRSLINFPSNSGLEPNQGGLFFPSGVDVDPDGNLWVADFGNGRVLRYPKPFEQDGGMQQPNLVLGQQDFDSHLTDASDRTMASPYGVAITSEGAVLASDSTHHRVLMFVPPFENGMAASRVFGQPDFASTGTGNGLNRMNSPRGLSRDDRDRLYVADANNDRILVFGDIRLAPPANALAVVTLTGVKRPQDVSVSPVTGKSWVAARTSNRVLRYKQFDQLLIGGTQPEFTLLSGGPLAVTSDPFENLYIADSFNRVIAHFQSLTPTNGANFLPRVAPGMITSVWFPRNDSIEFAQATSVPLPTELSGISVLVDGVPAPLYFVSAGQINFLMPNGAPSTGTVEVVIIRQSTQQIIASNLIVMDIASPGLFTRPPTGTGQVAALNQDNTINNSGNPEKVGRIVQIFATGAGSVPGAPPDGEPASGLTDTPDPPRVFVGAREAEVTYSGLAPNLVGVWQINVKIPMETGAGNAFVVVLMYDRPSGDPNNPGAIVTTIAVER